MKEQISLPPYEVQEVISSLSQVFDWNVKQYNIPETWKVTEGEGITVYVLDTGASEHPDLNDNVVGRIGFVNGQSVWDLQGHSTHCAGTIAAENNAQGMVGVAPKAKIVFVKCLGDNGSGSLSAIANALNFCVEVNEGKHPDYPKADVVSMSLGSAYPLYTAHKHIKRLYELNTPVIVAAGNSGRKGINYPAKYPETIAIGAHDASGRIANFSTYGPELDFAAPGVDIYSTYLSGRYAKLSGTSMATPFVAGIVALMLSKHAKQEAETGKNDCKTVDEVKEHLKKYSLDKGTKGKDEHWGYGIIDVETLIKAHSGEEDTDNELPDQDWGEEKTLWQKIVELFKKIFG